MTDIYEQVSVKQRTSLLSSAPVHTMDGDTPISDDFEDDKTVLNPELFEDLDLNLFEELSDEDYDLEKVDESGSDSDTIRVLDLEDPDNLYEPSSSDTSLQNIELSELQ